MPAEVEGEALRFVMEYTKLGKSDLVVSRICLGCMGFGDAKAGHHSWTLDYDHSRDVIDAALQSGINFFDTAPVYQDGTSEQYLGRALRELGKLEESVIATKFFPRSPEEIAEGVTGQQHVRRWLEKSLERLGTDHVDLYILHMWDFNTSIMEILEGLNAVREDGLIRAAGISNCFAWQLAMANERAKAAGLEGFVSVQDHFNLLYREDEREMMRLCWSEDIAMTPYSSLAAGRLSREPGETTKRLEEDTIAKGKYDGTKEADSIIIQRVSEIAKRLGVSMSDVAIAWLLTKVTAPVIGSTRPEQIRNVAKAVDLRLSPEDIAYLEEPYVPHKPVGVMDFNVPKEVSGEHVWPVQR